MRERERATMGVDDAPSVGWERHGARSIKRTLLSDSLRSHSPVKPDIGIRMDTG